MAKHCHYFNNRRTIYNDECVVLHEANVIDANEEESVTCEEIIDVDEQEKFIEQENEDL